MISRPVKLNHESPGVRGPPIENHCPIRQVLMNWNCSKYILS